MITYLLNFRQKPLIFATFLCFSLSFSALAQTEEVEEKKEEKEEYVFSVVEFQPTFPGGIEAMFAYIENELKYPENAKEEGISGRVYIQFIVEKDGTLSNHKVFRKIHESLDQEAMRIIKTMPNWIPGTQRGKTVRVRFNVPVEFKL